MTTSGGDEPISLIETDDLSYVVRVLRHAQAEGLGVQIWNLTRRTIGVTGMSMRWTVELYDGTPTVLNCAP